MLTRATRIKIVVFAVITVLVVGYTGIHYAKLGRFVGLRGYYVVKLNLANGGGLFQNADVDYRGVSIGRVGALSLTATGVQASLDISDSAPPIPAQLKASVADLSAVGEQYVDLRPQTDQGPYLTSGSVIPQRDTQLPLPVTTVLENINQLATSVPLRALRQVTNDLGTAFGGQGGNLQQLVDGSYSLVKASSQSLPRQIGLINAARTVLRTQVSETQALDSFGASARQLAATLAASNADIRKLIVQGPRAATQVAAPADRQQPRPGRDDRQPADHLGAHRHPGQRPGRAAVRAPRRHRRGLHRDHLRRGQLRDRADLLRPAALHRRVRRHRLPQRPGHLARPAQHLGPV